jgi:AcrR family transcriptional regulator
MNETEPRPTRPLVSREVILRYRRRRFADALARECAERGFRDTTVAQVVARAGTSRNSFYEIFSNREEAFMSLLELGGEDLFARIEGGCEAGGEDAWARVEGGLSELVKWIAERPYDAHVCLVEAASATPASLARQQEGVTRIVAMLRESAPNGTPRPPTLEEFLVGGIHSVLSHLIVAGETERAPTLVPDLSALLLAPYLTDKRR